MKEYIDRKAVYKVLADENPFGWTNDDLADAIRNAAPADVVEVKHGRWVSFLDGESIMPERYYRCSICRRVERNKEPYCNCGAKMDLEE